jgi:hypothetical protein
MVDVLIYNRTSSGNVPAAVESFSRVTSIGESIRIPESFSRVPSTGESIRIPPARFTVLDVIHVATSVGGGAANNPIAATILVHPNPYEF